MRDRGRLTGEFSADECKDILCGGNPGSKQVFDDLAERLPDVDFNFPSGDSARYRIAVLLDDLRLHDDKIWRFYLDVCGRDIDKMLVVMNVCGRDTVQKSLEPKAQRLDIDDIIRKAEGSRFVGIIPQEPEKKPPGGLVSDCDHC